MVSVAHKHNCCQWDAWEHPDIGTQIKATPEQKHYIPILEWVHYRMVWGLRCDLGCRVVLREAPGTPDLVWDFGDFGFIYIYRTFIGVGGFVVYLYDLYIYKAVYIGIGFSRVYTQSTREIPNLVWAGIFGDFGFIGVWEFRGIYIYIDRAYEI